MSNQTVSSEAYLTGGECCPARHVAISNFGVGTQVLRLTYFRAKRTERLTSMAMAEGGTGPTGLTLAKMGLYQVDSSGLCTLLAATPNTTSMFTGTNTIVGPISFATISGTATGSSSTTLTDSEATRPTNADVGRILTAGTSYALVISNTATSWTVGFWNGGIPASNAAYSLSPPFKMAGRIYACALLQVGTTPSVCSGVSGTAGMQFSAGTPPRTFGAVTGQSDLPPTISNASVTTINNGFWFQLMP